MRAASPRDREPPTAVVLGAAGFVGRTVCRELAARGWSVAAVARRTVPGLPPRSQGHRVDLLGGDASALATLLREVRPRLVVNAAGALWKVTDEELDRGNVELVRRVVEAVAALPRPARLVHIGSAYEYGTQPAGTPLTEDLAENPGSRYARTKLAGTRVVTSAVADGRLDAVVLRIAMSVGPHAPEDSLLGGIARRIADAPAELRLPPVAGVRDIVDVRDVADAVRAASAAPRVPPVVNVGSGTGVALTEAVDTLIRVAGTAARIVRPPAAAPDRSARRDAGIGEQPLDISLARRDLGWAPGRSLTDALTALWEAVPKPDGVDGAAAPFPNYPNIAVDGETIHG